MASHIFFKIWKFSEDPSEITKALGVLPDNIMNRGSKGAVPKYNGWVIKSNPREDAGQISNHWHDVISRLSGKSEVINGLSKFSDIVFTMWIDDIGTRPVLTFDASWIRMIASCGARLEVDYA